MTAVGDASAGVSANDGDDAGIHPGWMQMTSLIIDKDTGMITVAAGISDSTGGPTEADADAKYTRSDGGVLAYDT